MPDALHGQCEHRNWTAIMNAPPRCNDCGIELDRSRTLTSPCKWCSGAGAIRDEEGKLGADCPRCKGRGRL